MEKIGVIGGSGLEKLDLFKEKKEVNISTKSGQPSSSILNGIIGETEVFIISRHGRKHTIPPTQVNNRANILSLKEQGCTQILATTACGSLRKEIKRGDIVIPDQFIDFTRHRTITFIEEFEEDKPVHTPMADPFDARLREILCSCASSLKLSHHISGTVVTIEGPRFSTRAESNMFRLWGADVINMSTAPECTLANEAGIPYAAIALSTDYDCWKTDEEPVTWEEVLRVFQKNVENVTQLLLLAISKI
ncbi:MAG: S-methyl-5'-thioadenosine phosphorylase [Bacteroidota bacterium]